MELSSYLVKSHKLHSSANHHHYAHRIHRHRSVLHSFASSLVSTISEKSNSPGIHLKAVGSAPENSVFRYLQKNFEQLNNLSTSTMTYGTGEMSPQSLQHRQHYPESDLTTTMASFIVGSNGTESQQLSSATYDESVFSLLTLRNALIIILYSLIIVVSLPGNLLVCRVAFGTRDMRTTTNLLIASLACSDIVMTVFNIPFNVVRMLPISWPFGGLVCILVPLIQTSCVYVSTFTMTLIALHRLWTVRQRRSVGKTSIYKVAFTVLAIWLIALTLSLPHAAFNRVKNKTFQGRVLTRCMVQHPKVEFNFPLLLTVEVFFTQFLAPLSITLVVYIKIARVIARQGQLICKLTDEKKRRQSEAKRRRIFMLALAVCTFATCWAPINLYLFLVDTKVVHLQTNIFIMVHWFAMSSICYNPIIYCWLNEKFRNGAKDAIRAILSFAHFPLMEKQSPMTTSTILSQSI